MKANVLVESSTGVHGLFVRVEATGVYETRHIANYTNGSGLARLEAALDWAKAQLNEHGYSVGETHYNTDINEFEIEVEKVQKKPKASEIREALRPLFGEAVESENFDIYLYRGNPRVEFFGEPGNSYPDLEIEVDE